MARWLPNDVNEFFFSLARLIESCDTQVNNISRDRCEFLVRRLDEYCRTLSIVVSRFADAYGHIPSQESCLVYSFVNAFTSVTF